MAKKQTKLELTWIGKENRPKLEPRILIEDPEKSYHAARRVSENDIFDNRLIFGDNLLALKALEQGFTGKIKCICIDPPYNTGSAFEHYDDGVEHSLWLQLMRDRLELCRKLLAPNGSLWIIIDDNEAHYLKVLCDEVYGRQNCLGCVVWQHSVQSKNDSSTISLHHNYILAYKCTSAFERRLLPRTEKHNVNYSNPDDDPKGKWRSGDVRSPHYRENLCFDIITPSGKRIAPPENGWRWSEESVREKIQSGEIVFTPDETRIVRKIYLCEQKGRVPESIWFGEEVGTSREANREIRGTALDAEPFATPKPERLIERILRIATVRGDLVLDSFAGSGTTGAVAHKMGRRWIMVELKGTCHTHIIPRLRKVIDGDDPGGITEAADWKGGGGFRYYRLGPTLIVNDEWENPVINPEYNAAMLTEAICKLEGFEYAPSDEVYWIHGHSTETDFIYVTTQTLTRSQLQRISDEVGENRSLLVMCGAFRVRNMDDFPNLTVKKIPKAVLRKCEWGHDDYSLEIENLPQAPPPEEVELKEALRSARKFGKGKDQAPTLFDSREGGSKE